MSLSRPRQVPVSSYVRAPGVDPIRIATYPKRRRGFINDTRLASLQPARPIAEIRPISRAEPSYADFLRLDDDERMSVSA